MIPLKKKKDKISTMLYRNFGKKFAAMDLFIVMELKKPKSKLIN
jgi:hypothetical protein